MKPQPNCLRAARLRAGMTLRQAAAFLGLAHSTLHKMEYGPITQVPNNIIKKLSILYEEPPHKLLNWQGDDFFLPAEPEAPLALFHIEEDYHPYRHLLTYHMLLNSYSLKQLTDKYQQLSPEDRYTVTALIDSLIHKPES